VPKLEIDGVAIADIEVIPAETLKRQLADADTSLVQRVSIEQKPTAETFRDVRVESQSEQDAEWDSGRATIEVSWSVKRRS
jgi:hypothetical protein